MRMWRQSMFGNPATYYVLVGLLLLGLSLWVPWATAARTARIERRADDIATLLLEAAIPFVDRLDESSAQIVLSRFHRLAARDDVIVSDLEQIAPLPGTLLSLRNKHYAFHVATPPLPDGTVDDLGHLPSREVLAWPLAEHGPGHCAFFHADDAPRAFSRNLTAQFHGLGDRRPRPGAAYATSQRVSDAAAFYRSADDERWLFY